MHLQPVRAWHPALSAGSSNALVCPVYDTLSEADHARYGALAHNAATFTSRPSSMGPAAFILDATENLRAALASGKYEQDPAPSLYVYGLRYAPPPAIVETLPKEAQRTEYLLLGLVGSLDLAGASSEVALHERVFDDRVKERIALTEATGMNFAPIMVGYTMPDHAVNDLLEQVLGLDRRKLSLEGKVPPVAEANLDGAIHRLWRLEDPKVAQRVTELLAERRGLILDGHHRYSAALARHRAGQPHHPLTMLVESRDRALLLLPWHRVLAPSMLTYHEFSTDAPARFPHVQYFDSEPDVAGMVTMLRTLRQHRRTGFMAVGRSRALLVSAPGFPHEGADYDLLNGDLVGNRHLDPGGFSFVRSPREAMEAVASDEGVAFLMPPLSLEGVERAAFEEHRVMAQKSTMFLPKVAEGLIFAPADDSDPPVLLTRP